ncbi:MAG: hypothetical protein A2Z51_00315 [Deltaproteobacteria bacterium RBG_19FT_COMBO_52_11]|nr:MAG: hypothetical protein A2Z51_00315 [Deltaproteobacteria bacterium RBG_19FT_COMBO_52_11]
MGHAVYDSQARRHPPPSPRSWKPPTSRRGFKTIAGENLYHLAEFIGAFWEGALTKRKGGEEP